MQRLHDLIREQRVLLLVGAGASTAVGYPTFDEYARTLLEDFRVTLDDKERDASGIADSVRSQLASERRLDELHAHLERSFGPAGRNERWAHLHEILVGGGFRGIVTTNYDSILEDAARAAGDQCEHLDLCAPRTFAVFEFLRSVAASRSRAFILHLHGYFRNPAELVITTSDYQRRYGPYEEQSADGTRVVQRVLDTMHRKVVWALLVTYPVLFVGFSMRDPALRHFLDVIDRDFERGRDLDHYAILGAVDEDEERLIRDDLARYGVIPIFYRVLKQHGYLDDHSALGTLIESLSSGSGPPPTRRRGEDFTTRMLA